jgi:beta-lactamase regulating signal transducer with metallopeptidase domain
MTALNIGGAGWTSDLLQALFRAAWQGGLMLVVVWVISRTCPRVPAWLKVWLWRLAFIKLLLFALPELQVPLLPAGNPRALASVPATPTRVAHDTAVSTGTAEPSRPIMRNRFSTERMLFTFWVFGVGCFLIRLALQWLGARRLCAAAEPVADARLVQECGALGEAMGLKRLPRLLEAAACPGPLLVGIVHPAIVLPANWSERISPAKLRLVLAHELAHMKRRDLAWGWVTSLAEVVFFFHPLVWICRREWTLNREIAADELALRATRCSAADYGAMLLDLVGQAREAAPALALQMFETKQSMSRRIIFLRSGSATKHIRMAGFLVLFFGVLAVLPWRLVAQTSESDEVARLRKENELLREELARAKSSATETKESGKMGRDADLEETRRQLDKEKDILQQLSVKFTDLHPLMFEQRAKIKALERQIANLNPTGNGSRLASELARTKEELDRLLLRVGPEHPKAQELRARMDQLRSDLQAGMAKNSRQQVLYKEELALAQQELAEASARLKIGIGSQQELRKAQREMIHVKKDFEADSLSRDKLKALLKEELALAEEDLAEAKKQIDIGVRPIGSERALQREILRLKREQVAIGEPKE